MATTSPTRIDDDIFEAARVVGGVMNRSASQQVTHWARIGRELEASPNVSHREVIEVLKGERHYDSVGYQEQAIIRAEWGELADRRIARLNLVTIFEAANQSYVELDDDGQVMRRNAQDRQ